MKSDKEILLERAISTAKKNISSFKKKDNTVSVVEFSLASEKYAFEKSYVSEVLILREITPIPGTPPFVMGVVNLRSKILSIINLKSLFNLKDRGLYDLTKVIVLGNGENCFGIVSDSIFGIREVDLNSASQPPLNLNSAEVEFISGIFPDGQILLNAQKLLTSPKLIIKQ